jgi:membrane protein implicated in regulation of membrane protease activity
MSLFTPTFYWQLLGLSFIALELCFPSLFFCLSLSCSSFIAAVCSYFDCSQDIVILLFIVTTPLCFTALKIIAQRYNRHISYKSSLDENFFNEYRIIKNDTTYHIPKIMYQGIVWSVHEKDKKELHHNDRVKTLYIKGNSFIITKIN